MRKSAAIGRSTLAVAAAVVFATPAAAYPQEDADYMRVVCKSGDETYLRSYLQGVVDTSDAFARIDKKNRLFCMPTNMSFRVLMGAYCSAFRRHPEWAGQKSGALVAILAFRQAFPCRYK
jgi:hypothetical protein